MADEGTRPSNPAPQDPPPPAAASVTPPAAAVDPLPENRDAALERERWLRDQVDKERMLLLLFGRHVVHALGHESPALHFWRWLIDDLRSARREEAEQLTGRHEAGGLTRLAIVLRRSWRGMRWRRIVSG